jgi:hypothetical protein
MAPGEIAEAIEILKKRGRSAESSDGISDETGLLRNALRASPCRYVLRPPLAAERVRWAGGHVTLELPRARVRKGKGPLCARTPEGFEFHAAVRPTGGRKTRPKVIGGEEDPTEGHWKSPPKIGTPDQDGAARNTRPKVMSWTRYELGPGA